MPESHRNPRVTPWEDVKNLELEKQLMDKEIDAAVAAERKRCAKMVIDYAEVNAYDPEEEDDLKELAARILEGVPA